MEIKHCNIIVSGFVQGVGFRYAAKKIAAHYDIKGFVKNQTDAVYIEAEGENQNLELFIYWCSKGPTYAKVDEIKVTEGAIKQFTEFSIKH
jgi:acylphosphatase